MAQKDATLQFVIRMRDEASRTLKKNSAGFKGLGKDAKKAAAGLKEAKVGFADFAKVAAGAISVLLTAGKGVSAFRDFDLALREVGTLLPGQSQLMDEYRDAIERMSLKSGDSVVELSKALYQVVSAFGAVSNSIDILEIANKAAIGGIADTESAVKLLSATTKAYGDTSTKAVQKVSDLALLTVRLGVTTFPELAASMQQATPTAETLGVTLEELYGTMATLTGVSGNTAKVVTQLNQIFVQLVRPMPDLRKVLAEIANANEDIIGTNARAIISHLGLAGAIKALSKHAKENNKEITDYIKTAESAATLFALLGPLADTWAMKMEAMGNPAGVTQAAYEAMSLSLDRSMKRLSAAFDLAFRSIGEVIAPAINALASVATHVGLAFLGMSHEGKTLARVLEVAGVSMAALVPAMMLVMKFGPGLKKLFWETAAAARAFSLSLLTNPLVLIGAAIVAAGAALYYFKDATVTVGEHTFEVGELVGLVWDKIAGGLAVMHEKLMFVVGVVRDRFGPAWVKTGQQIKAVLNFIIRGYQTLGIRLEASAEMGKLAFLDMIETLFLKLGFLGDALNSLVQLDFTGARESAALAFGEVHTEYGVALERVQDDTDAAVAALAGRDYISEFGTQARALAGGLVDAAVDWVDPLLAEAAKRSAQAVVDGVAEADVGGANTEAILKNMDEFSITMDKVKQGIAGAFGGPEGLIADAKITVSDLSVVTTKAFNGMASSLTNFVMTGKADFKGFARSVITDITAMIVKAKLLQFLKMIPGLGDLITGAEVGETGGIVGKLGGPKAQVPSFMFAGAQEYAKGGAVPVLAHQGEGIFTPKQMDNADRLFASMAQAPATPPRVTVNISTPAGTEASVSQKQSGAGGQDLQMDVMVEQVENRMSQNIQSGGGLASTMEQQYGLDRSRGQYR